ncbi:MAG: LytR/AlgR family response regulator transcription factor [Chloroflexota bacterium]
MFENLNQPYIFNNNFKHSLKTIMLVTMGYMLIVLYFQPFGINFLNSSGDGYFVLGSGIFTALTFFVNTQVLQGIFPKTFDPKQWTIKKEIIQNICMFIFLSASFGLLGYFLKVKYMEYSMPLVLSCALALLPIGLFNLSNYNNSLKLKMVKMFDSGKHWLAEEKKHLDSVRPKQTEPELPEQPEIVEKVVFTSENMKETVTYNIDDIIVLRSSGNYVEIYYRNGKSVNKNLIRQTLSNLEGILTEYPQFIRSHRCYLVNTKYSKKLSLVSGKYSLNMLGIDFEIPVSRNKHADLRKSISLADVNHSQ